MKLTRILILLLTPLLTHCIPYMWANPPAKIDFSGGIGASEKGLSGALQGNAGIYPMQVLETRSERNLDVGLGYSLLYLAPHRNLIRDPPPQYFHGPYIDLIYFLPTDDSQSMRFYLSAKGKMTLNTPLWGYGVNGQIGVEFFDFANGSFERCGPDGCNIGHAYGESAIGFFIEGSQLYLDQDQVNYFGLGISFRIPATAGIGWAYWR